VPSNGVGEDYLERHRRRNIASKGGPEKVLSNFSTSLASDLKGVLKMSNEFEKRKKRALIQRSRPRTSRPTSRKGAITGTGMTMNRWEERR